MLPPLQFDHLGLVVRRLELGRKHLDAGIGGFRWTREWADPINGVRIQFGIDQAGVCYELLEPLGESSPVYKTLKSGAVLAHVAYRVPSLAAWQERLRGAGWAPTASPKPAMAYGDRLIQFFVSPLRLVIEIIEASEHEHIFEQPV